ncbi:MAG: CHRD domain-containing protein [Bacteroidota bacterium]
MRNFWKYCAIALLTLSVFFAAGCDDDDNDDKAMSTTYSLEAINSSGVSGTVTFKKQNNTTTLVTIQLSGTQAGNSHPAHIHSGNVSTGGPVVLSFNPVEGSTGKSETTVTKMDDGTLVKYEELIAFNGHVNIHLSVIELQTMIAQGNIGANSSGTGGSGNNGGY